MQLPWIQRRGLAAVGALLGLAAGQSVPTAALAQRSPTDSSHQRPRPLFTGRDALLAVGFAGATVALFPLDQHIAQHLHNPSTPTNNFLGHAATGVEYIASPGAYVIGGSLYAIGRIGHFDRLADLGWHGTEAVIVGDVVTGLLKGTLGRARPYVSNDTNPRDFKFGGGFSSSEDRTSFPSGHTTDAFSAAAAVTAETSKWWPHSTWIIGPVMYGGATLVGLSRMYHNRHWASDVALGAAIGTFSGRKVVQFNHDHPHNRLDQILLRTTLAPDGRGGMMVAWTLPAP